VVDGDTTRVIVRTLCAGGAVHDSAVIATQTSPVRRLCDTPIGEAGAVPGYGPLFNAGVLYHVGRYHLFVRAVRDGYRLGDGTGPRFVDYVSDIVVFTSPDGQRYEYG
jgi:hypothetical protein